MIQRGTTKHSIVSTADPAVCRIERLPPIWSPRRQNARNGNSKTYSQGLRPGHVRGCLTAGILESARNAESLAAPAGKRSQPFQIRLGIACTEVP